MPQIGDYARLNRVYVNSEVKSKVFLLYPSLILPLKAMHPHPAEVVPLARITAKGAAIRAGL